MPLTKHNSRMELSTGLISSRFDISSPQTFPFANRSSYCTFVLLYSSSFHWQPEVSIYDMKLLSFGFFGIDMDSLQGSFLHCYLFVMLFNKLQMKCIRYLTCHFLIAWLMGHALRLPFDFLPALSLVTGFKQRSFLHIYNTV